jgi:hypothetical protein
MGRGQFWYAYGQVERARVRCVNLARLSVDFTEGAEGYEKLEAAVPGERLRSLQATFCLLERAALFEAAGRLLRCYEELAVPLAAAHGVIYPADLARQVSGRLERLRLGQSDTTVEGTPHPAGG